MLFPFPVGNSCKTKRLWIKHREKLAPNQTWYEVDILVESPTKVVFNVYGMKDFVHGGRGTQIGSFVSDVDKKDTSEWIAYRLIQMAHEERIQEEEDAYRADIARRAKALRKKYRKELQ